MTNVYLIRHCEAEGNLYRRGQGWYNGKITPLGEQQLDCLAERFRAVAAKGADGSGALAIVRYSNDDNVTDTAEVTVSVPGASLAKARCHLTDSVRTHTEVPLAMQSSAPIWGCMSVGKPG